MHFQLIIDSFFFFFSQKLPLIELIGCRRERCRYTLVILIWCCCEWSRNRLIILIWCLCEWLIRRHLACSHLWLHGLLLLNQLLLWLSRLHWSLRGLRLHWCTLWLDSCCGFVRICIKLISLLNLNFKVFNPFFFWILLVVFGGAIGWFSTLGRISSIGISFSFLLQQSHLQ